MLRGMLLLILLGCSSSKPAGSAAADSAAADSAAADSAATDSAATETGTPPLPDGVSLGEVQLCAEPLDGPIYAEVGGDWGLEDQRGEDPDHEENPSLAAADLDGDGAVDLVIFMELGAGVIYYNRGDHFETAPTGVPGLSVLPVDADGDGDLDLAVGGPAPFLLINDQSDELPLEPIDALLYTPSGSYVHDLSLGDLDGDGSPELYAAATYDFFETGEPSEDRVLNLESRSLIEGAVPPELGDRHTFDALWFDADGDGDQDVYIANDLGMNYGTSTLLRSEGGGLVDATADCFCEVPTAAKGIDLGDYNRDGRPDLYVTGTPLVTLLSQAADGAWIDVSATTDVSQLQGEATAWGGGFLDYDNDGYQDILSAQGDRWNEGNENARYDVTLQLLRQVDGAFVDTAAELGLTAVGSFRAAMAVELNGDGVQDLVVSQMDGRAYLYLSQGCTSAGWIDVEAPLGSVVSVQTGETIQTDWVRRDAGYLANRAVPLHFGLGEAQAVDAIRVRTPRGEIVVEGPIEGRRVVTIAE